MRPVTRTLVPALLLGLVFAAPLGAATVARERIEDVSGLSYHAAIAVGSDGVVHRVWREGADADTGAELRYARGGLGDWSVETIDTREAVLKDDGIAVDAQGRVHVAYYWNNREDPLQPRFSVSHAVRTDEGWVRTTLASPSVLAGITLALDPEGRPRVGWLKSLEFLDDAAHSPDEGPAVLASFDGVGWSQSDLPVDGMPYDLHVDAAGVSHLLVYSGGDSTTAPATRYLTDASGSWSEETLPDELSYARLSVHGDGPVHVADLAGPNAEPRVLRHFVRASTGWETDSLLEDDGGSFARERLHLRAGPDGAVHILFVEQQQETWDGGSDRWMVSLVGGTWTREVIATREDSAEIEAVAVGPDGVVHVLCGGREADREDYLRIGGPDMDADLSGLRVVHREDGSVAVRGVLRVRNLDQRRSGPRVLRLARAERDDFRSGDASVGRERRIRPLRPGARQSIRVSAVIRNPGPEERLLLVAEPRWFPGGRAEPVTMGSIPLGE